MALWCRPAAGDTIGFMRLWPLPLAAGLAPAIAISVAFWISVAEGYVVPCNPFFDGCVSLSRAARHGLANHVFRAILLPAAALQAITWILCATWLRRLGATGSSPGWLPWLGTLAAVFVVVYGTFLGSEGPAYQWMRRYGITVYFGCTFLGMLVATRHLPWARWRGWLGAMLAITLAMGLANYFLAPWLGAETKNRVENILEWFAGLAFTSYFCALAWLWRRTSFDSSFSVR